MNFEYYKIIHLLGVMGIFAALGAVIATQKSKGYAILHGVALLLILVSGFGMLAKAYNNTFAPWVIVKLVVWFLMGGVLAMAKRKALPPIASFSLILLLGAIAAYFGVMKAAAF